MAVERIDSLFNTPEITQEFELVRAGLVDSQKGLTDLFNTIKSFKSSTISTLADNTTKLNSAITGSIQATTKAAQNFDNLSQKIAQQTAFIKDNATSLQAQATSYDQLIKQAIRNKLAMDDLSKSQKEAKAAFDAGATSFSEYAQSLEEIRAAQQTLKTSNSDINKQINALEKQAQSAGGSVDNLAAKLTMLRNAYDKLGTVNQNTEQGQALLKNINETDAALQKLKNDSGRFGDNVGNYSGAFVKAFDVIKQQLAETRAQMSSVEEKGKTMVQNLSGGNPIGFDPNKFKGQVTNVGGTIISAGDAATYQQASAKVKALQDVVDRAAIGFRNSKQEAKLFQEAARQVGVEAGIESEEFRKLSSAVGHGVNELNDLAAATKYQAQDAKIIVGIANAAATLAGAFGAVQAAEALWGNEDKDTQKQLAQFQQLLVLINGLQAAANGLQEESAGIQLLMSINTKLNNAAQAARNLILGKSVQIIVAETATEEANAVAREENAAVTVEQTVAEEAQTVAVTANTEATVANAVAQKGAATASKGLIGSLGVGGVAGIALAAGVGLALLTAKLIGFGEKTKLTAEQQKDLAEATKELMDALEGQAKLLDTLDSSQARYYSNLIADAQAAGASQYALLLAQQRADKAEGDRAQADVDRLGATNKAYSDQAKSVQDLLNKQQGLATLLESESAKGKKGDNRLKEDTKNQLDAVNAQLGNAQHVLGEMTSARNRVKDANQKASEAETRFNKLSLDDQLAYTEKIENLRASLIKVKNDIILGDERSTLRLRLAAMKSNVEQENAILAVQAQTIKNNPSNFINGLLTPEAQNRLNDINGKQRENLLKNAEDRRKLAKQVADRQQQDAVDAFKAQQDAIIAASQDIEQGKVNNPNPLQSNKGPDLSDRLSALATETEARRNKLNADLNQDLEKEQDAQEDNQAKIKLIIQKYDNDLLALQKDHQAKYLELEEEARQRSLKEWDRYYAQRKSQIDEDEKEQIVSLNGKSENDKFYSQYRQKIEDNAAIARASAAVQDAEVQRNATKAGTKERADSDDKLTQAAKTFSDAVKKRDQDVKKTREANTEDFFQTIDSQSKQYMQAITDVADIGYNTQKVHLEELEARQQRAYEQESKNITDSTASEEQKSIRLKILDDQRQVQKEQHDRKQRQLDIQKAQFDKAKDIASIITGTALAVVKALDNGGPFAIAEAIAAGALGAAELAAAIATPLPHYKEGIGMPGQGYHPGGGAVVGDGGEKELILEPGRTARWSANRATRESLLPYTKVIPSHKINEMIMSGMFVNQQGALMNFEPIDNRKELKELKEAVIWSGQETKAAIKSSRPRIVNKITVSASWQTYVHNAVFK